MSYIPDALIFTSTLVALTMRCISSRHLPKATFYPILGILGMFATVSLTAILYGDNLVSTYASLLRTISPLLLLALLLHSNSRDGIDLGSTEYRAIFSLIFWIVALVVYGILFLPPDMNRGEQWLGTAFGGLHESAYTLLGAAFLAFAISKVWPSRKSQVLFTLVSAFTVITLAAGWGVRTVGLIYLLFLLTLILNRLGIKPFTTLSAVIIAGGTTALALFAFNVISAQDVMMLTSGRTAMYIEKAAFLSTNTTTKWALGNGFGSDLMYSDVWWWAAKGSHNDYLSFLTEYGLAFVFLLAFTLFWLFRGLDDRTGRFIFLLSLMTSLASNGYLVRPAAAYGLIIAIALLSRSHKEKAGSPI